MLQHSTVHVLYVQQHWYLKPQLYLSVETNSQNKKCKMLGL